MKSRQLIAGNWKMNLNRQEAQSLLAEISGMLSDEVIGNVPVVLFPPFPYLMLTASQMSKDSRVKTGAQTCSSEKSGAFTGEVSADILASCGVTYVLAGHSERRTFFGETDAVVVKKVKRILEAGMSPVFCCGEDLNERESGNHFARVKEQLSAITSELSKEEFSKTVIAYEPVWAIGTGKTATSEQAGEMHSYIREFLRSLYGELADNTTMLYGGSCNEKNAASLFQASDVDGGLIGGASLQSRSFLDIIKSLP
jgi:triosephosphate isomerase (TIM)